MQNFIFWRNTVLPPYTQIIDRGYKHIVSGREGQMDVLTSREAESSRL